MLKNTFVIIVSYMLLTSCDQRYETTEIKPVLEVSEKVEINEGVVVDQEVKVKSAVEKISPDVLATLDILTEDYDRDLWWGPDQWDDETWAWKVLLKWDKECDYRPEIFEKVQLNSSPYKFIHLICLPGAGNPMSYAFLLDKNTKESVQLKLGNTDRSIRSEEIWGHINVDANTNMLSILSVSRGVGDCGDYRKFDFIQGDNIETSKFELKSTRKQECIDNPAEIKKIPYELTDYKNWPIVDE